MHQKILVVEDEKSIADAIVYALRREGFTVEAAYNGEEALNTFDLFKPDVMIFDVMLPGIDGYGVLRKLENKGPIGVIARLSNRKRYFLLKKINLHFGNIRLYVGYNALLK